MNIKWNVNPSLWFIDQAELVFKNKQEKNLKKHLLKHHRTIRNHKNEKLDVLWIAKGIRYATKRKEQFSR